MDFSVVSSVLGNIIIFLIQELAVLFSSFSASETSFFFLIFPILQYYLRFGGSCMLSVWTS